MLLGTVGERVPGYIMGVAYWCCLEWVLLVFYVEHLALSLKVPFFPTEEA